MYKCDLFLQTKQMVKNKLSATFVVEINGVLNKKKKSAAGEFYSYKKEFSPYSSVMRNSQNQRKSIYTGSHHIFITLLSGRNTLTIHRLTQIKRIYLANRVIMSYWSRQKTGQFSSLQFNLYITESQQLKG